MKKIISIILASTSMFGSIVSASGKKSPFKEKAPKLQIEDLKQKREPKITKSHVYVSQKAFLIGIACAVGIDVKIKFIPDNREKNYNFKILSIDDSDFAYSDFNYREQLSGLIAVLGVIEKPVPSKPEIVIEKGTVGFVIINKHVMTRTFISEIGEEILNLIYEKKIIAAKKNNLNEPVDLTEDEEFQEKIECFFADVLDSSQNNNQTIHNFHLPSIF